MQMRGERQIIERLLQTEIVMLRAIRDGSALMQHMEDFYYIALLEVCLPVSLNLTFFQISIASSIQSITSITKVIFF
jgi:hypothetical protein